MHTIYLLEPLESDETETETYIRHRTRARIISSSRKIFSDLGVEAEEGITKFSINRRNNLDTSWLAKWKNQFYKIEGISPGSTLRKIVLTCKLENIFPNIIAQLNLLALGDNVLALGDPSDNVKLGIG